MADDWLSAYLSAPAPDTQPPLLDLRPAASYTTWHATAATHFNGVSGEDGLAARLSELPPSSSHARLGVLAAREEDATAAIALLQARGHAVQLVREEALWGAVLGATGPSSRALWRPSPLVAAELPRVTAMLGGVRSALDVGAGAGRDSAFLAGEGFRVVAVDRDAGLVRKAVRMGRREARGGGAVEGVVRTFGRHLGEDRKWLRAHAAGLVVVVRFLRRGVLELLFEAVREGGLVVYEHFLRGCEEFGGPRKESQMLEVGELATVFTRERGFTVLRDDTERLDDGRPVVRFVAHRNLPFVS